MVQTLSKWVGIFLKVKYTLTKILKTSTKTNESRCPSKDLYPAVLPRKPQNEKHPDINQQRNG